VRLLAEKFSRSPSGRVPDACISQAVGRVRMEPAASRTQGQKTDGLKGESSGDIPKPDGQKRAQ
jgi:hypothetical protein